MEREKIKELFGKSFIGFEEQIPFFSGLGLQSGVGRYSIPPINYSVADLEKYSKDCILILGCSNIGGKKLSIRFLRDILGVNAVQSEPCFYNQDWYINESFLDKVLEDRWYLVKKEVFSYSRAVSPIDILKRREVNFPSAILCAYTFFANYFYTKDFLWEYDFVWCSDKDHNGDRIYVGKYRDLEGFNNNGFSIHRHLALRDCYGAISTF